MTTIKLDFRNIKYFSEIHKIIKETFEFPDFYGENLSALWDCLTDYCPNKSVVIIDGIKYLNDNFDGYGQKIQMIFERLTKTPGNGNTKIHILS